MDAHGNCVGCGACAWEPVGYGGRRCPYCGRTQDYEGRMRVAGSSQAEYTPLTVDSLGRLHAAIDRPPVALDFGPGAINRFAPRTRWMGI